MNIDKLTPTETAKALIEKYSLIHTKDGVCDMIAVKESALAEVEERYQIIKDNDWGDQSDSITKFQRVHLINTRLEIEKIMKESLKINITDPIVYSVIKKFNQRSELGQKKYGTTLNREDLTRLEWINHLQEELMDAILYCECLKQELHEKHENMY